MKNGKFLLGLLLAVVFAASVLVRVPNINRPMSWHHEWLTAMTLRWHQIWLEQGALTYKFNPITTYPNKADKHIDNIGSHMDKEGNRYYTSMPPFSYILPYLFFRLLNIYPDVLPLQVFNLIFHFASCLLIYLLVHFLTRNLYRNPINPAAFVGFLVYLFLPATLWFHSNVYLGEIFVQPFYILGIYLFIRLVDEGCPRQWIYLVLLGVCTFFMVYTDWLGVFFAFFAFLYALCHLRRKGMIHAATLLLFSSMAAVCLTVFQYSQISGFQAFVGTIFSRFVERSGNLNTPSKWVGLHMYAWQGIYEYYLLAFRPFICLMTGLLVAYFFLSRKYRAICVWLALLIISAIPWVLWHYSRVYGFYSWMFPIISKAWPFSAPIFQNPRFIDAWTAYAAVFSPFFILTIMAILTYCIRRGFKKETFDDTPIDRRAENAVWYLCMLPVILNHLMFVDMTRAHHYYVLKSGVFIAVLIAVLYSRIDHIANQEDKQPSTALRQKQTILHSLIAFTILLSVQQYLALNRDADTSLKNIGENIRRVAKSDEVVFIKPGDYSILPQLVFYAHRNVANWQDEASAKQLINSNGVRKGVIFILDSSRKQVEVVEYIEP